MIVLLRCLFVVVLVSMLASTVWAGLDTPLSQIPREVLTHPWFVATLLDAYWSFVAVYLVIAWKETAVAARILWFVAVIALGNIAIALYALRELFAIPRDTKPGVLLTTRRSGGIALPAMLAIAGLAAYLLA